MRIGSLLLAAGLMVSTTVYSYDIGLVPLHEFSEQEGKPYRKGSPLAATSRCMAHQPRSSRCDAGWPK